MTATFAETVQRLPKEAYLDSAWYQRECRELFDQSWAYACTETELFSARILRKEIRARD